MMFQLSADHAYICLRQISIIKRVGTAQHTSEMGILERADPRQAGRVEHRVEQFVQTLDPCNQILPELLDRCPVARHPNAL